MIFDGLTTEQLFTALEAWNKFHNESEDEGERAHSRNVIEYLIVSLQLHWL